MTKILQEKLLEAYYAGAIPLELLKKEQNRITEELAECELALSENSFKLEEAERVIRLALKWASSCYKAYRSAEPQTKRKFNRAFFKKNLLQKIKKSVTWSTLISFPFYLIQVQVRSVWSGWPDLNRRPQRPERCALNQTALHPDVFPYKSFFYYSFKNVLSLQLLQCSLNFFASSTLSNF